jgi:hypothetical protein
LVLAAIFVAVRRDLNAGDFISRGVEGIDERRNKSTSCCYQEMEMPCLSQDCYAGKLTGLFGSNTC